MLWDEGVLAPYKTEDDTFTRCIEIKITDELPPSSGKLIYTDDYRRIFLCEDGTYLRYEGAIEGDISEAYMRIERMSDYSVVQVKPQCLGCKSVLTSMELEHTCVNNSGVLFHAACISLQGEAVLFTAPSGTGKSTQAQLWIDNRDAELINGDRCIISCIYGSYYMCGVPYCGSSRVSKNMILPIKAVVYLTQAPVSRVHIIKGINSFKHLWEGCCINTWNSSDVERSMEVVTGIAENVPVLRLDCTPDVTAVNVLEKTLEELSADGN